MSDAYPACANCGHDANWHHPETTRCAATDPPMYSADGVLGCLCPQFVYPEPPIVAALEFVTRVRAATEGRPEDGPYPATIGEVADEIVTWIDATEASCANGLRAAVLARLSVEGSS